MNRVIIGTAGHIDHGKTTLVKALTGLDTDRLKEEKQRGISIELGFAPITFPNGQKAAIVDVPGHERFVRHMLAGASGIDLVMLVIAADEGVMPQTREHLAIIELLGVDRGVVAITKKDMVEEDWLMLIEEEVREHLGHTVLKDAPIAAVSAATGEGIPELLKILQEMAGGVVEKPPQGQARLPIDRVFTITGFGTVVTGTLWSGELKVGDTLELLPIARQVRIRNLEVHDQKVDIAQAGQRVAVNLQGVEVADIERGYVLASPGYLTPSFRLDVSLRLLSTSPRSIKHWARIRFHLGTDENLGRVILLEREELMPGEETYAQIVMEKPVVASKDDRFVVRFYSPITTIGGGHVIDPNPSRQKRFDEEALARLAVMEEGTLADVILQELQDRVELYSLQELVRSLGVDEEQVRGELAELLDQGEVYSFEVEGKEYLVGRLGIEAVESNLKDVLQAYHKKFPLRRGYPREELRSRHLKGYPPKAAGAFLRVLQNRGSLTAGVNHVALPGHRPHPDQRQQQLLDYMIKEFSRQPFAPPGLKEIAEKLQLDPEELGELVSYLLESEILVKAAENAYFLSEAIERGKQLLQDYFAEQKELTLGEARDIFKSSRRYTLPLMEYYDRIRFTKRLGDIRVRFKG
ncbi:MAG: selenocysteine-specific translation elongation factor [Syntrophomonadaceae bacterium]|nr:selenocysteine-specific translation elongation factor [Syntrophomonadaceae bacterium]